MEPRILVIEDEAAMRDILAFNLSAEGFHVTLASDARTGLAEARRGPDLIILDWMLPDRSGLEVLKALRAQRETKSLPVILLTARGAEVDRVLGLELGADDYITKPFSVAELIARIRAVLRRSRSGESEVLRCGPVAVDPEGGRAWLGDSELSLTRREFGLLAELVRQKGRILSRSYLLDRVWGSDYTGGDRTVDVHIRRLRDILEALGNLAVIETVRGMGYRLREKS